MNNNLKKGFLVLFFSAAVFSGASFAHAYIPDGDTQVWTMLPESVTQTSASVKGDVWPGDYPVTVWFVWGTTPDNLNNTTPTQSLSNGHSWFSITQKLSDNLAPNTAYFYKIVAKNSAGQEAHDISGPKELKTLAGNNSNNGSNCSSPIVYSSQAVNVGSNSATFRGSVTPNSGSSASVWFEYGKTSNLGQTTYIQTVNGGYSGTDVSSSVYGLDNYSTYYYRIVAKNSCGQETRSNISSFYIGSGSVSNYVNNTVNNTIGAPQVITLPAEEITSFSALLLGRVYPNNAVTTGWLEWGTDPDLSTYTSSNPANVGSGSGYNSVNSRPALVQNTTYYYRAAALNSVGVGKGVILSFTTSKSASAVVQTPVSSATKPIASNQSAVSNKKSLAVSTTNNSDSNEKNTDNDCPTTATSAKDVSVFSAFSLAAAALFGGKLTWGIVLLLLLVIAAIAYAVYTHYKVRKLLKE